MGLLGAGAWAQGAHLPGYARDPRCKVVAIADPVREKADAFAREFGIPHVYDSHEALLAHHGLDAVDVCTPSATHFALSWAALEAGKHVLCEKPVAYDYAETRRAAALAAAKGLKTKLGFTFRYSPGMRYMKALIDEGFIGEPFIFNGFEQNSQWLDPQNPLRQVDHTADQSSIQVSSLEGYGAPIMDIGHLCMGSRFAQVVGTMKNFIPERMVRATGTMMRMNIDDGDIFIGEFANGAIGSIQTSFVTVGNYPGIEARVYGSKGALICRMVEENGVAETLKAASADAVEFRELEIPQRFYPTGGSPRESWRSLFYANLTHSFISEIRGDVAGNEGNFEDGAHVQELINAVERSYRQRRWVSIPLERDGVA
ncbi:Gfo/Idh/MocA family oxidoreductase [Gemmatimonas sp.]|uniref:Gfo/Idh/MocA family protein n=1 Tax=Gemmatimonas sp. TaxID=1962908 RepID=UPI0025BDDEB0|nr:Gfo/Idh/MocA family oxidoreductase [Gemmatimonas sp.]